MDVPQKRRVQHQKQNYTIEYTHEHLLHKPMHPRQSKELARHQQRGKLKPVDLNRIILQDRTLYSPATFSQLIPVCLKTIAFLAFKMEEIIETQITPSLSRTFLPPATKPLNKFRCSNPPSTKTPETPSYFNDSLQIIDKIAQLKKTRFTVSSLPQPPT